MTRGRLIAIIVGALVVDVVWATLPPRARQLSLSPDPRVVRGAIHVHTTHSDGAGTPEDVAAAAHRAGLDFVILTDHGDGLRMPDRPRYVDGVLVIDAVEISTADGHYVALGIGQAPYRLAGDARDVIEDVHRLGGFGFAAHPDSPKPDLRWREWTASLDGVEWVNADSDWRDETRATLARVLVTYWFRGPESIAGTFDRPVETLARWDRLSSTERIAAIAGADAHERLPLRPGAEPGEGASLHVPSYESSFRAMSNSVRLGVPLTKTDASAASDAALLLSAIRAGHVFTVIDGVEGPARLDFHAESADGRAEMGDDLVSAGRVRLSAAITPPDPDATVVIMKDGHDVATPTADSATTAIVEPGEPPATYRVEVRLPGAPGTPPVPWIVSNPIYVRDVPRASPMPAPIAEVLRTLTDGRGSRAWAIEKHAASDAGAEAATLADGTPVFRFAWRLGSGRPAGQYAALALPVSAADFADADRVAVSLRAPQPMRISVQMREPQGDGRRWQRSVYVDATPRTIDVPFSEMRGIEAGRDAPLDPSKVTTLLLVVDTVNALPGSAGEFQVGQVAVVRSTPTSGP